LAKKFVFCTQYLPFLRSVALLCNLKMTSIGYKTLNFRLNTKKFKSLLYDIYFIFQTKKC
jgi:hypothetical protein